MVSFDTVEHVVSRRGHVLEQRDLVVGTASLHQAGRLLLFDPDTSLGDGAASAATSGFFDDDNVPPWDTWLMFIADPPQSASRWTTMDSYLLSWIPSERIDLVQRGIDANPEECLLWAEQVDRPFVAALRRVGI